MSFGLGQSFGRLCRLEEQRKEVEPPKVEWIDENFYRYVSGDTLYVVHKDARLFFSTKVDESGMTSQEPPPEKSA